MNTAIGQEELRGGIDGTVGCLCCLLVNGTNEKCFFSDKMVDFYPQCIQLIPTNVMHHFRYVLGLSVCVKQGQQPFALEEPFSLVSHRIDSTGELQNPFSIEK